MTEKLKELPKDKGTYILILFLDKPTELIIGKLGTFTFTTGWYAYTGSAFGAGGLRGRLKHHLKTVIKPHWHIDYLRQAATVQFIWYFADNNNYEHEWAEYLLAMQSATVPAKGFGASDCRCKTHLIYLSNEPAFNHFCEQTSLKLLRYSP